MTDQEQLAAVVNAYAGIARPILVTYFGVRGCIAATRATLDTFARFGVRGRALAYMFKVTAPSLKLSYVSGLSEKAKAKAKARAKAVCATWQDLGTEDGGPGYQGHVCAIIGGRWFVDPSFDQAGLPDRGMLIEPHILTAQLPRGLTNPKIVGRLVTGEGLELTAEYFPLKDRGFRRTEAWRQEMIPVVAELAAATVSALGWRG